MKDHFQPQIRTSVTLRGHIFFSLVSLNFMFLLYPFWGEGMGGTLQHYYDEVQFTMEILLNR